ncbi:transglycosylase domain-containing protein [Alteribacillus iranensis]|uniref:Penicillin-binding protein 1A n=1 Tax=Alteribacillus iranensis TaxID=930128 RepID=A0A1I2FMS6_9BACI|nr:transglycosylase domain-containing protein [Alteribacillus iranensis]SFF06109.1 penicillin-binding protein 1A [Alteribacillus iranensis]
MGNEGVETMKIATGYTLIFVFLASFVIVFANTMTEAQDMQSVEEVLEKEIDLETTNMKKNSFLYDKNNKLFTELRHDENRRYITYEEIPEKVIQAFLSTEDQYFYEHEGVYVSAVARALINNAKAGGITEGASTITQQVVRNLFLSHEQTYNRKLNEALYAYQLEKDYSKEEILELYVNSIYFNHGVYGFETASQVYFNKTSSELSSAEIAFLAAIPANPSHYDPLHKKENTLLRMEWILEKMTDTKVITEEEKALALQEQIDVQYHHRKELYPDYAFYIEHELKQLIGKKEGFYSNMKNTDEETRNKIQTELNNRVTEVLESGIHIETYLDPSIQQHVTSVADRLLTNWGVQGASVVIDHATNRIVAMSGGAQYKKYEFQRAFQAYRQPGSAIKPLLVYGPYLDSTGKPMTSRVSTNHICYNGYCPSNAGNGFYGSVPLTQALTQSYNTAAVRLLHETGIEKAFSYIEKFGFTKIVRSDYNYPAALGGFTYGITPLELTKAYTVLSNDGTYSPSRAIKKVTDKDGNVLYEWKQDTQKIWDKESNDKLRYMMRKVVTEGTGKRANIPGQHIGGKTGTTNLSKDYWFVGYNNRYTTGVWIGHDNPSPIRSVRSPHMTLWKEIVTNLSSP